MGHYYASENRASRMLELIVERYPDPVPMQWPPDTDPKDILAAARHHITDRDVLQVRVLDLTATPGVWRMVRLITKTITEKDLS